MSNLEWMTRFLTPNSTFLIEKNRPLDFLLNRDYYIACGSAGVAEQARNLWEADIYDKATWRQSCR